MMNSITDAFSFFLFISLHANTPYFQAKTWVPSTAENEKWYPRSSSLFLTSLGCDRENLGLQLLGDVPIISSMNFRSKMSWEYRFLSSLPINGRSLLQNRLILLDPRRVHLQYSIHYTIIQRHFLNSVSFTFGQTFEKKKIYIYESFYTYPRNFTQKQEEQGEHRKAWKYEL